MIEDIKVPKEDFLIKYFDSKKKPAAGTGKPFNEVLQSVQIKIDKKKMSDLQAMPADESKAYIDHLDEKQALDLLKETVATLNSISGK